jgi:hypothetical protein
VRLNAQVVIRYLGNPDGIAAIEESYRTGKTNEFTGAVPVPLSDWGFQQVEQNLLCDKCSLAGPFINYIYALEIDGSDRARRALGQARMKFDSVFGGPILGFYGELCSTDCNLERAVSENAFFLGPDDRKTLKVGSIARSDDGTKALLSVRVNHGPLKEKWFHVVVTKKAEKWKYLSVSFAAQS